MSALPCPANAYPVAPFPRLRVPMPLFETCVQAGFPSPAEGYQQRPIDLNELLITNPPATFILRVEGESMRSDDPGEQNIGHGDLLIVNRALEAKTATSSSPAWTASFPGCVPPDAVELLATVVATGAAVAVQAGKVGYLDVQRRLGGSEAGDHGGKEATERLSEKVSLLVLRCCALWNDASHSPARKRFTHAYSSPATVYNVPHADLNGPDRAGSPFPLAPKYFSWDYFPPVPRELLDSFGLDRKC